MSTSLHFCNPTSAPGIGDTTEMNGSKWYAVQTRARHEKVIAHRLREQGISTFLPLVTEVHRWSDRKKIVELPLFSCYLFARLAPTSEDRSRVLRLEGVFQFVGVRGEGTPIPDEQIDAVRILVKEHIPVHSYPFLRIGQRVRIRSGALNGVEGILVARNGDHTLIVSIEAIQRSLAVRLEGYDVEPV
ncbi:MAG TPA: UpxY family transcription antiterminator [Terriglobales bacterium]|nr:UpxY family transcription antiterminator [Terriglobales bacterium]